MNKKLLAIFFAILAAGLYAINIPLSKLLLNYIEPTMMASYLYLGAGIALSVLLRICEYLGCDIGDICSVVKSKKEDTV